MDQQCALGQGQRPGPHSATVTGCEAVARTSSSTRMMTRPSILERKQATSENVLGYMVCISSFLGRGCFNHAIDFGYDHVLGNHHQEKTTDKPDKASLAPTKYFVSILVTFDKFKRFGSAGRSRRCVTGGRRSFVFFRHTGRADVAHGHWRVTGITSLRGGAVRA
jgi:hypothetical protein